jgi:hypothetical protein
LQQLLLESHGAAKKPAPHLLAGKLQNTRAYLAKMNLISQVPQLELSMLIYSLVLIAFSQVMY